MKNGTKTYTLEEANERLKRAFDCETWFGTEELAQEWVNSEDGTDNYTQKVVEAGTYYIVDADTMKIEEVEVKALQEKKMKITKKY